MSKPYKIYQHLIATNDRVATILTESRKKKVFTKKKKQ